jgi:hypothetical protein
VLVVPIRIPSRIVVIVVGSIIIVVSVVVVLRAGHGILIVLDGICSHIDDETIF